MTTQVPNDILEKVKKLLALSESSNEHEAALAAAKASELLAKYNLDRFQVEHTTFDRDEIVEIKTDVNGYRKTLDWMVWLSEAIADHCFCRCLLGRGRFYFIGSKKDAEIAVYMFNNLALRLGEIASRETYAYSERMRAQYGVNPYERFRGSSHPRVWRNSFLEGAVSGIRSKLQEQRKDFDVSENTHALVVVKEQLVNVWVSKKYPKLGTHSTGDNATNWQASQAGFAVGRTMSVQGAVSTQSSTTKLLG